MPIILLWNAAAMPFEAQVTRWLKEMDRYSGLIGKWLGKRVLEAEKIERQSRGFPIVLFYNMALTARLAPVQRGALVPEGPPGLGESFRRIGAAWNLPEAWKTKKEEATLLPRLFGVLAQISAAVRGSVTRLKDAPSEMFTPGKLKAVDLLGLASLTFRSVGQGRKGILAAGERLHETLTATDRKVEEGAAAAGKGEAGLPLAMRLDNLIHLIAGGLLAIPAAAFFLQKLGADIALAIRHLVMEQIVGIERKVLDFRQALLGGINAGLQEFAFVAVGLLVIVREQVGDFLRHNVLFAAAYVDGLTRGIEVFFSQFKALWDGIGRIITDVMKFLGAIAKMNIGPLLHAVFKLAESAVNDLRNIFTMLATIPFGRGSIVLGTVLKLTGYSAPDEFKVTVEQLVLNKGPGERAHDELQKALRAVTGGIRQLALQGVTTGRIEWLLRKAGYDIDIDGILSNAAVLLERVQQDPVKWSLPKAPEFDEGKMPDLEKLILTPARTAILKGLEDGGNAIRKGAEDLTVSIIDFLDSTAVTFTSAADRAAVSQLGPSIPGLHDAVETEVLANFPAGELRIEKTGLEPLAEAYKAWLVQAAPNAGMQMTGAAVAGYLTFVLDEWDRRQPEDAETPVAVTESSPRILLERARLGRVHMPKLVIRATGRETDAELAARVAEAFREAVGSAFATGKARLKGYAEIARKREAVAAAAAKTPAKTPADVPAAPARPEAAAEAGGG